MKKVIMLFLTILFLGGCAVKTPLAKISNESLKNNALVIGSFSRNLQKSYFRESSIKLTNINTKEIKSIFTAGSGLTYNSFKFNDDFKYRDSQGSIFATLIPMGEYYMHSFYTGDGPAGYYGDFSQKLKLNAGDILYLGDIKYEPILSTDNAINIEAAVGAKCTISNNLNRDFNIFKKHYPNIISQNKKIKILNINKIFNLNNRFNVGYKYIQIP